MSGCPFSSAGAAAGAARRAARNDARVMWTSQPLGWLFAEACRWRGPLVRIPGVGAVVSGAQLAQAILQRDEDFTKNGPGSISAIMTQVLGPSALGNMDGEPHRALRARLANLFTPAYSDALIAEVCGASLAALRSDLAAGKVVDVVRFMRELSGRITLHMMGAPASRLDQGEAVVAAGEELATHLRLSLRPLSPRRAAKARAACDRLVAHARAAWDADGGPPASMVRRLRELGLTFEEARGILALVFLAGAQTTSAALPRIVAWLVDGGEMERLRARPEAMGQAIDEGLRLTTPVPATVRIAARDAEAGGHAFRKGERIVVLTYNLARDPARLDLDRERVDDAAARRPWYGGGPHFCMGFALAQRELAAVLESLLAPPGRLTIVRRRAARRVLLPCYASLDVRVVPA